MNLALRVASGVVLVAVIAAALWIGTPAVAILVGAGALIGAWELRGTSSGGWAQLHRHG